MIHSQEKETANSAVAFSEEGSGCVQDEKSRSLPKKGKAGKNVSAPGKKSDLGIRCIAGFVYVVATAVFILLGDITTALYLAFLGGVCAFEFYRMMKKDDKLVNSGLGVAAAAGLPIVVYFFDIFGILIVISVFILALVCWYVFWPKARIIDLCLTVFGAAYMGMPLSCLLMIRLDAGEVWGGVVLLAIFASVWVNDVGAYLVGRQFGRHKMAPKISPKKSWEGFFGGLIFSVAFWCLMTFIPALQMSIPQALLFGAICGSLGVVGDLAESRIKRNVGVKDSGNIMPGHGGLFDRCDSLLTVSIAATVLLYLGGCIPHAMF